MNANARRARWARLVGSLALSVALLAAGAAAAGAPPVAAARATASAAMGSPAGAGVSATAGRFTFDVYRSGSYSEQATWRWCTAASVQIIRNIDGRASDHGAAQQRRFFRSMRASNRFQQPQHRGVDPQGFEAGLRRFADSRYRIVASRTYEAAVRSAVTRLRQTGLPVALLVARGRHAWVLTGFTATADPAATSSFRVLSVRIVGPLYGRQSAGGYDPAPDTRLSYAAFRRFLLRYRFPFAPTPWTGRFVTIQPIPAQSARAGIAAGRAASQRRPGADNARLLTPATWRAPLLGGGPVPL
jgi:hypothetical protein